MNKKDKEMMNKNKEKMEEAGNEAQIPENFLIEALSVITKYRKFIYRFILVCTLATTLIAFILPKWYKSVASVFPADKADLLGGLEGISSIAKSFSSAKSLVSLGSNSETDRYLAILKSGTVLMAVINKFDLVHVYDITSYPGENTILELLDNVSFATEDEGNLTITVYDKSPQRAADMANYFVEMLNKTNTELQVQNARANRSFIEERYKKNISDLTITEDSLKYFQKKYGIIALPEQLEASIKTIAEITGELALKEVQANVLKRTQTSDNPMVLAAQIEINELQKKLTQINNGTAFGKDDIKVIVPFNKIPDLGGEYIRHFREVEIQYKILQFITPLYEQAKVEENRQTPSVLVLDKAFPAERKSKPRVSIYLLLSFVISSFIAFVFVFLFVRLQRMYASDKERYDEIMKPLRSDWHALKWTRNARK